MASKRIESSISKFISSLTGWLGPEKTTTNEILDSLDFITVALKDVSPGSMLGSSLDNTESGLEELEDELGTISKAFSKQRNPEKAKKAKQFQSIATALISKIQKLK